MLFCRLPAGGRHDIDDCNFRKHICEQHLDRVMAVHDLIYVFDGEWEIYQDGIPYTVTAGQLLFLNAHHHHYGLKKCTGYTMYLHITCDPGDDCGTAFEQTADAFVFPNKMTVPASSPIPSLFKNIISHYWNNTLYSAEQSSAYLSLLLSEMSLLSGQNSTVSNKEAMVNKLIRTMQNTPQRFFSVDELCTYANISRKTLYNYFIGITGLSPHEYQIVSKLKDAEKLIECRPELPLEKIALTFGFCDVFHFSKAYKQYFGYSPRRRS